MSFFTPVLNYFRFNLVICHVTKSFWWNKKSFSIGNNDWVTDDRQISFAAAKKIFYFLSCLSDCDPESVLVTSEYLTLSRRIRWNSRSRRYQIQFCAAKNGLVKTNWLKIVTLFVDPHVFINRHGTGHDMSHSSNPQSHNSGMRHDVAVIVINSWECFSSLSPD